MAPLPSGACSAFRSCLGRSTRSRAKPKPESKTQPGGALHSSRRDPVYLQEAGRRDAPNMQVRHPSRLVAPRRAPRPVRQPRAPNTHSTFELVSLSNVRHEARSLRALAAARRVYRHTHQEDNRFRKQKSAKSLTSFGFGLSSAPLALPVCGERGTRLREVSGEPATGGQHAVQWQPTVGARALVGRAGCSELLAA